ncbi:MAG TPA: hypothetical protein VN495_03075 [Candidatus Paceibacterota bacterium]|nr:hypothetical protein [Candidatus Paceibacterota bacterium]
MVALVPRRRTTDQLSPIERKRKRWQHERNAAVLREYVAAETDESERFRAVKSFLVSVGEDGELKNRPIGDILQEMRWAQNLLENFLHPVRDTAAFEEAIMENVDVCRANSKPLLKDTYKMRRALARMAAMETLFRGRISDALAETVVAFALEVAPLMDVAYDIEIPLRVADLFALRRPEPGLSHAELASLRAKMVFDRPSMAYEVSRFMERSQCLWPKNTPA